MIIKMTEEQVNEYRAQKVREFDETKYCFKAESNRAKTMSFDELLNSSNTAPLLTELTQIINLRGK